MGQVLSKKPGKFMRPEGHVESRVKEKKVWRELIEIIERKDLSIAKDFLAKHPSLNVNQVESFFGLHLLHIAVKNGDLQMIQYFVEQKQADIEARDRRGYTPLIVAASKGYLELCQYLIEKRANVNARNEHRYTPLFCAAKNGHLRVCQCLVSSGANINSSTRFGLTAFSEAAVKGHVQVCRYLIDQGADFTGKYQYAHGHETLIFLVSAKGHLDICQLLIDNGIDIHQRNEHGITPLLFCAELKKWSVCDFLLKRDADINVRSKLGTNVVGWAIYYGEISQVKYYCWKGAIPPSWNEISFSPNIQESKRQLIVFYVRKDVTRRILQILAALRTSKIFAKQSSSPARLLTIDLIRSVFGMLEIDQRDK
jgi:ankyrin repeat protein